MRWEQVVVGTGAQTGGGAEQEAGKGAGLDVGQCAEQGPRRGHGDLGEQGERWRGWWGDGGSRMANGWEVGCVGNEGQECAEGGGVGRMWELGMLSASCAGGVGVDAKASVNGEMVASGVQDPLGKGCRLGSRRLRSWGRR